MELLNLKSLVGNSIVLSLVLVLVTTQQLICENRKPEGHTPIKSDGDGSYKITVIGPHANIDQYVPNEVYTGKDSKTLFESYFTQKLHVLKFLNFIKQLRFRDSRRDTVRRSF